MAVLSTKGKREPRRVGESHGCAMNYFSTHCERLEGARPQIFHQQQIREPVEFSVVSDREDGAETLLVDILQPDVMVPGHTQMTDLAQRRFRILARHRQ